MDRAARMAEIGIGVIFLATGTIKVWDPVLFFWDAMPYAGLMGFQKQSWVMLASTALLLGPLEFGLGLALLVHWQPRWVFPAATALLVFFTVLTVSAWAQGRSDSCGCFGVWYQRGVGQTAVEDFAMLGLLVFAWTRASARPAWDRRPVLVLGLTVLALGVGSLRLLLDVDRIKASDLQAGARLKAVELKGVDIDLGQGDHLVMMFSPHCGRCRASVPRLNRLMDNPGVPRIVALTSFEKDSSSLLRFVWESQPKYPIATISTADFLRLTAWYAFPRLAYVQDGVVRQVWENDEFPTRDQLAKLRGGPF